ncbi:MAG: LysR family transcriptional regulator [Alphaproteobacteria bacterium]|nr:LysR family transcriptional regulator [Alphaproteobacteria bacterium]
MRILPSLTTLRVFEAAGKELKFTQAAKQLHVTQGAVSRQIKQLEEYLGVPLFVRLHHKLELTDAGRQLLLKLEQSFNLLESAVAEIRDPNQRQKLTILAPPSFTARWLASRLADFRRLYPDIELSIYDHFSSHVMFDCEVRFGMTAKPRHFSELLFLEQHVPVCSPDMKDRAAHLEKESNNLLHIRHEGEKLPIWENWLAAAELSHAVQADRGMSFSTLDQVTHAIRASSGFAIIDKHMIAQELKDASLVQFSDVEVTGPYGYWLDIPAERQGLSKVIHFTRWLREQQR